MVLAPILSPFRPLEQGIATVWSRRWIRQFLLEREFSHQ
jgi:hypothetical protein